MSQLEDRMVSDFRLWNYSEKTEREYLRGVRHFTAHYMRSPLDLGKKEVRGFLDHLLVVRGLSPAGVKTYVAALKFLYTHTLDRPEVVAWIPWPKVHSRLPAVLDPAEVKEFLFAIDGPLYRALLVTTYATGLRISEACSLRIEDLDGHRGVIHVHGKCPSGNKCSSYTEGAAAPVQQGARRSQPLCGFPTTSDAVGRDAEAPGCSSYFLTGT